MRSGEQRARKANPVALSAIMDRVVKDMGFGDTLLLERLRTNWQIIVGPTIARKTRPVSLDDGVLTVGVTSPSWITQLRLQKQSFLDAVNESVPGTRAGIRDISFEFEGRNHE